MLRSLLSIPMLLALVLCAIAPVAAAKEDNPDKERSEIREASRGVLERLYAARPEARAALANAAGFATFRNKGLKLGIAGGGRGRGMAVTNPSRQETFMKFVEVQAGLGIGVKKYDLVFVFATQAALDNFINKGWQYSGQTTLAAKSKNSGRAYQGAVSVAPDVFLYQITEAGLAAEITAKGTKYSRDEDLN